MKKLFQSDSNLNSEGEEIRKEIKDILEPYFLDKVKVGVDPNDLLQLSTQLLFDLKNSGMEFLNSYFSEKKYNTDKLKIKCIETNEEKYATYLGMGKQNKRLWKYEAGWEPTLPYSIADENGHQFWWLHIDINCE